MEFLKFIFSNFWTFMGFFLLCCVGYAVIKALFDFVVELIHGKQTIQHINLPEGTKIEASTPKKMTQDAKGKVSIDGGDISVRRNN